MRSEFKLSRRKAIQRSLGLLGVSSAAPLIVPRRVLGGPEDTPPSDLINFAVIGQGGMGRSAASGYLRGRDGTRLVATCDVDPRQLDRSKKEFAEKAREQGHELAYYADFRKLLENTDVDAVHVATPPHWHVLISIMCLQVGWDVKCEKPMTRYYAEAQKLVDTARQYGRICVVNSGGLRSGVCVPGRQLVEAGLLGKPLSGRLHLPYSEGRCKPLPKSIQPPPEENPVYDMWCGPAPYHPWRGIVHSGFRHRWDYDGGMQADIGAHRIIAPVYVMNKLGEDPVEFKGEGHWPPDPKRVHPYHQVEARYADGTPLVFECKVWGAETPDGYVGVKGPAGEVFSVGHGRATTNPPDLLEETKRLPEIPRRISFPEAIRTRDASNCWSPTAQMQLRVETILALSNISLRTGRTIRWDPVKRVIIDDPQANSLLNLPVRAPWRLY